MKENSVSVLVSDFESSIKNAKNFLVSAKSSIENEINEFSIGASSVLSDRTVDAVSDSETQENAIFFKAFAPDFLSNLSSRISDVISFIDESKNTIDATVSEMKDYAKSND